MGPPMAIYHLSHGHIGRGTQKAAYTSAAHSNYITRPTRATEVQGERMPTTWREAAAWLQAQEDGDRKNARVIDKIEVALPKELTHAQNAALIRDFAEEMTQARAPWLAAMHDGPDDADNPHAHIIFRDRDFETGRRVMETTERGSTERFRECWERQANLALERAGRAERIDRRTLEAQGIDREPEIHVGPQSAIMEAKGLVPVSEIVIDPRWSKSTDGRPGIREAVIDYPAIDQGRTRSAFNDAIKARNADREAAHIQQQRAAEPAAVQEQGRPLTMREKMEASHARRAEQMRMEHEEEKRKANQEQGRATSADGTDWTDRPGMVAQQRSAMENTQAGRAHQERKRAERGTRRAEAYFTQRRDAAREQAEERGRDTSQERREESRPSIAGREVTDRRAETKDRQAEITDTKAATSDLDIERARSLAARGWSRGQAGRGDRDHDDGGRDR